MARHSEGGVQSVAVQGAIPAGVPARGLYVQTFGGFRLYRDGCVLPAGAWRRRPTRLVLVRLLLVGPGGIARRELQEDLWPGVAVGSAGNRLRVVLHALRRTLQPDLGPRAASGYLQANRRTCALTTPIPWDLGRLRDGLAAAESAGRRDPRAVADLRRDFSAVQGPWLADEPALTAALAAARPQAQAVAARAALCLMQIGLERGERPAVVRVAEQALRAGVAGEGPWGERLRAVRARAVGRR